MLTLENRQIRLQVSEDGEQVVLTDRRRGCSWRLDPAQRGYRLPADRVKFLRLGPWWAAREGEAISLACSVPGGSARSRWTLGEDYAQVALQCDSDEVEFIALPGMFYPEQGPHEVAIPVYQGMLLRGRGSEGNWEEHRNHGGHMNFSMAMGAVLHPRGALLVTHECATNWHAAFGRGDKGPYFRFEQQRCPVDGWAGAAARFYPMDADLTALCRRYRRKVKDRGELVPWADKIAERPMVKNLFGAMMAFTGYNKSRATDYAASARALRERGFESVFYYPLRMLQYSLGFQMGGDDPIWLTDDELAALRAVPGAHPGPWGWCIEGLDDGSKAMRDLFIIGRDGKPIPNWKIDRSQWYLACTPYQIEHMKQRFAGDMKAMDWVHYDVSAMFAGVNCFSTDHALHGNRPLGRLGDVGFVRQLFSRSTVGDRVVSSEGFGDHYAAWYDIGSTKVMPIGGDDPSAVPVPMTMLVFHDSCIQDWWEVHNYNEHAGFPISPLPHSLGRTGCGLPRLKAAMDALMGLPPNLFPFGRQYYWTNFAKRETASYEVRLSDAPVQEALAAALPIARLHKRIGMLDLTGLELLSDDALVQATTFSDGTRIVANLSERPREAPGVGPLGAWEWREAR